MKIQFKEQTIVEKQAALLKVSVHIRYWEDGEINGEPDSEGVMPCRKGDLWCPVIDIDNGMILAWDQSCEADIHYKGCGEGTYTLMDKHYNQFFEINDYVPSILCPSENGYGDYIIMHIDKKGMIRDWNPSLIAKLIQ